MCVRACQVSVQLSVPEMVFTTLEYVNVIEAGSGPSAIFRRLTVSTSIVLSTAHA